MGNNKNKKAKNSLKNTTEINSDEKETTQNILNLFNSESIQNGISKNVTTPSYLNFSSNFYSLKEKTAILNELISTNFFQDQTIYDEKIFACMKRTEKVEKSKKYIENFECLKYAIEDYSYLYYMYPEFEIKNYQVYINKEIEMMDYSESICEEFDLSFGSNDNYFDECYKNDLEDVDSNSTDLIDEFEEIFVDSFENENNQSSENEQMYTESSSNNEMMYSNHEEYDLFKKWANYMCFSSKCNFISKRKSFSGQNYFITKERFRDENEDELRYFVPVNDTKDSYEDDEDINLDMIVFKKCTFMDDKKLKRRQRK